MLEKIQLELQQLADPDKAQILQHFFKTGPGEYGEGDIFLGITVPQLRQMSKKYYDLTTTDIKKLLCSSIHEKRMLALLILVKRFQKGDQQEQENIFNFYLDHIQRINNWDLIDTSCEHIVGAHLSDKEKQILLKLAKSDNLWQKRIAMISTFYYIKRKKADLSLQIAEILLHDKHDLIHKAVGWMLREVGTRCDKNLLLNFLNQHATHMPRTMLRYAIEKLTSEERRHYLKLKT